MAVIGQILGWTLAVLLGLIIASFAIDAVLRINWGNKPRFTFVEGDLSSKQLLVVLPGAFSEAEFQLQPVVANLQYRGHILHVEQSGKRYSSLNTAILTAIYVADLVREGGVDKIHLLGTSQGAAVAVMAAQQMRHGSLVADHIRLKLIAVDGVGRPDDLRQPNWVFGLMGWLPFGPIWDRLGFLNLVIQPSSEEPATEWAEHAKIGLEMVRGIPTAFWSDQMRELGSIQVTAEELASFDHVTYVSSSQDEAILKPEESLAHWQGLVPQEKFRWQVINAGHTAYEMKPRDYALAIDQALNS